VPAYNPKTDPPVSLATIDIGSNAIRLLVGQISTDSGRPQNITHDCLTLELQERWRAYLRLGTEVFSKGRLSQETQNALIQIIQSFLEKVEDSKAKGSPKALLRMTATSAMRDASNQKEVRNAIFQQTKLPVVLLEGSEEAQCLLNGLAHFPIEEEILALADLGGGSLEISLLKKILDAKQHRKQEQQQLLAQQSLDYGALRLKTLLTPSNRQNSETRTLLSYDEALLPLKQDLKALKLQMNQCTCHLFLAGGGAKILANLLPKLKISPASETQWTLKLSRKEFLDAYHSLKKMTPEKLKEQWNIPAQQADLIHPALEVFRHLETEFSPSSISLSFIGLKEASMLDLARNTFPEQQIHLGAPLSQSPHVLDLPCTSEEK